MTNSEDPSFLPSHDSHLTYETLRTKGDIHMVEQAVPEHQGALALSI
jgi:hypothetical protein